MADSLDFKSLRAAFNYKQLAISSSELFLEIEHNKYLYIFNYGVVVYCNLTHAEQQAISTKIEMATSLLPKHQQTDEEYQIVADEQGGLSFTFNELRLPQLNTDAVRIAMLHVAQSAALDYYNGIAESLLAEIRIFTDQLEEKGRLSISRRDMQKFIGRALRTKNSITENLYIFDAPESVWNDEYLDKINQGLVDFFELRQRFREVEQTFKTIDSNLEVFRDLYHHRESSRLEWVIIILIVIEVVDTFLSKL